MSLSLFARKALVCWCVALAVPVMVLGQGNYATNGGQYPIAGVLPGEQVHPQVSLNGSGGYLVWEDNITDGYGLGVSALKVDSTLSGVYAPFRVNSIGEEDQERPVVSLLKQGGAAFVWQGGKLGFQHVYARFLAADGTWVGEDILVNSAADRSQLSPAVATLANGNVVVVYGSMNQVSSNSLQDVFGQILTPAGQKVGGELLINQFTTYNQRSASVAALSSGGFVVAWISEQERSGAVDAASADYLYGPTNQPSVDVFARAFGADGTPATGEILVNSAYEICANPAVAAGTDGGFMVTWQQRTLAIPVVGYDILARPFSSAGVGGIVVPVNTYLYGDQYDPRIAALGTDYFVVWTSLAQDGAREGVFGRFLRSTGEHIGAEVLVNTTTVGQQMHPCVAADGRGRFLTVWTSFVGGIGSFDLFAQRWVDVAQPLQPMDPPYVYAPFRLAQVGTIEVYQPELQVSWPILAGLAVDHYEVYVNGASSPAASLTTNIWLMTAADGLTVSSTNSFRVAYVAADGRRSPLSAATTRATWSGYNWGGIPFEWMSQYYGGLNIYSWPSPNAPVAQGGPTLLQVFLTGANPLDSATWLRTAVVQTPEGYFLTWNPQPGLLYQVQTSPDLTRWADQGGSRFAAGSSDSVYIGGNNTAYYRVLRLR